MKIYYTNHLQDKIHERLIFEEWIYSTITAPDLKVDHTFHPEIISHFKKIEDANNKVLRVVLKKLTSNNDEYLVITCYFDRKMRDKL